MLRRRPAPGVAVVTGASSGIGRVTARRLCEAGARTILVARDERALERLATQLGPNAEARPADVRDPEAIAAVADDAVRRHGGLDLWVNDAGVAQFGSLEDTPPEQFRAVVDTNLMGTVHGARAALLHMRRQPEGGVIVNVSSLLGRVPAPLLSAYVASKYAIRGFSASLRQELQGTDVQVCTVLPGVVDTPIFHHAANLTGREVVPLQPRIDPERVAGTILSCARRPRAEVVVGTSANLAAHAATLLPAPAAEWVLAQAVRRGFFGPAPAPPRTGNLDDPAQPPVAEHGGWPRLARRPTGPPPR
jgi:short-subunit dehydrogenase